MVYHGIVHSIRAFKRAMSACGAREANASVVSRAFRCARCAIWSAPSEQPRHACSGQPNTPGSKKARYKINCGRFSNKSSRLTLPWGPSNSYFFSTDIQGIGRRSAASASRERVNAFSFTRSCWRAVSHSCCDTIGRVLIADCIFLSSLFLSLVVAILFLLVNVIRIRHDFFAVLFARNFHRQRCQTAGRNHPGDDKSHGSYTEWTHCSPPRRPNLIVEPLHLDDGSGAVISTGKIKTLAASLQQKLSHRGILGQTNRPVEGVQGLGCSP